MTVKIKGTAVEINFWFAAVLTFLFLFFLNGNAGRCFLLCILHEAGHLLSMFLFKSRPQKICFGFFGMKIVVDGRLLSPVRDIIIAASGPLINLTLAAILYYFKRSEPATISLGLGIFNLLPVPMLDGGHILLSLIKSEKAVRTVGLIFSVLLLIIGIAVAVFTRRNFTVLTVSIYLLFGCVTGWR